MQLPVINHPDYVAKINDDNKFPIKKFGALADHLLKEKVVKKFFIPKECSIETMKTSHSLEYINQIKNKTLDIKSQKKIGFPINDSVVRRSFVATGGTVLASKLALDSKLACNTAGGSHHATFDFGAGYCVFNDTAVAANYLKNKGYAKKILILDLDVHQGNGNSEIFQNDKNVLTFSMHCASNYPAKKSKSDIDIELEDNMEETGGDLNDYVKLNQDYSKLNDNDVLYEYYKQTKPHLTNEEINFLMEDSFSYDEEVDEERDIKRKNRNRISVLRQLVSIYTDLVNKN
mgnify:CR=1 FL=1